MKDLEERIEEVLEGLKQEDKFRIQNEFCERNYYDGDIIFNMSELDYVMERYTPYDILWFAQDNDFTVTDSYFKFDGDNLESTSWIDEDWFMIADITNYIVRNDESFGIYDIREILDEENNEDEDEGE